MPDVKTLVIRTAGTNCDLEMKRAFELAGSEVVLVHLDRLIADPELIERCDIIGFPGGFSYGDDVASGRIFAMKCRLRLYPALRAAAMRGVPMIGVCNGFQVMAQLGLLPGPGFQPDEPTWADKPPSQKVALAHNLQARFLDDWVRVEVDEASPCLWTKRLVDPELSTGRRGDALRLPLASAEGRFVTTTEQIAERLLERRLACLRYVDNVNGSVERIAGVCDVTGRIFGLMPHPDRYLDWTLHPYWTRLDPEIRRSDAPGLRMFRNAVEHVKQRSVATGSFPS